jgi:hypothetical protein
MVESGLTPFQVLESGTRNVARYVSEQLKRDGAFGTVAEARFRVAVAAAWRWAF